MRTINSLTKQVFNIINQGYISENQMQLIAAEALNKCKPESALNTGEIIFNLLNLPSAKLLKPSDEPAILKNVATYSSILALMIKNLYIENKNFDQIQNLLQLIVEDKKKTSKSFVNGMILAKAICYIIIDENFTKSLLNSSQAFKNMLGILAYIGSDQYNALLNFAQIMSKNPQYKENLKKFIEYSPTILMQNSFFKGGAKIRQSSFIQYEQTKKLIEKNIAHNIFEPTFEIAVAFKNSFGQLYNEISLMNKHISIPKVNAQNVQIVEDLTVRNKLNKGNANFYDQIFNYIYDNTNSLNFSNIAENISNIFPHKITIENFEDFINYPFLNYKFREVNLNIYYSVLGRLVFQSLKINQNIKYSLCSHILNLYNDLQASPANKYNIVIILFNCLEGMIKNQEINNNFEGRFLEAALKELANSQNYTFYLKPLLSVILKHINPLDKQQCEIFKSILNNVRDSLSNRGNDYHQAVELIDNSLKHLNQLFPPFQSISETNHTRITSEQQVRNSNSYTSNIVNTSNVNQSYSNSPNNYGSNNTLVFNNQIYINNNYINTIPNPNIYYPNYPVTTVPQAPNVTNSMHMVVSPRPNHPNMPNPKQRLHSQCDESYAQFDQNKRVRPNVGSWTQRVAPNLNPHQNFTEFTTPYFTPIINHVNPEIIYQPNLQPSNLLVDAVNISRGYSISPPMNNQKKGDNSFKAYASQFTCNSNAQERKL